VIAVKEPGKFEHTAQRLRDERADLDALTATLTEAGVKITGAPSYDEKTITRISRLRDSTGEPITAENHATCPGHAAYIGRVYGGTHRAEYVCLDPRANGHTKTDDYGNTGRTSGGAMTEQEKTERREVVANNKAWKSAETVRRTWLRTLAARKTAPTGAGTFLAHTLWPPVPTTSPTPPAAATPSPTTSWRWPHPQSPGTATTVAGRSST
jgi:ParB family chromosome partitioning protein